MKPTSQPPRRQRLDDLLVARGLFASARAPPTRSGAARSAWTAWSFPAGQSVRRTRPLASTTGARLCLPGGAEAGRRADRFGFDVKGCEALDVGASTGGFTQLLLERGAAHVTALDVGHGQLHASLAADPRVTSIEGLNARDLTAADLGGRVPDLVVCDVSFISLKLALPPALDLAAPCARAVLLVKPQFEGGARRSQGRAAARPGRGRKGGARPARLAGRPAGLARAGAVSVAHRRRRRQP